MIDKVIMTRQEQIKQEASFYQLSNSREKFIEGAKWADEHPRKGLWDKNEVICWIKEYFQYFPYVSDVEEVIDALQKSMEE